MYLVAIRIKATGKVYSYSDKLAMNYENAVFRSCKQFSREHPEIRMGEAEILTDPRPHAGEAEPVH